MNKAIASIISAVIITTAGLVACLQTEPTPRTIAPEESKIQIARVPGLESQPVVYEYYGWRPAYQGVEQYYAANPPTTEEYYAAGGGGGGPLYPRLEVHVYVVAPGWDWDRDLAIDQDYIKGYRFFRDRAVSITARRSVSNAGVAVVPFQVSGANCFAFVARDVAIPHPADQKVLQVSADGYYCTIADTTVDNAMTTAVLSNILVTDSLLHPRAPVWPVP